MADSNGVRSAAVGGLVLLMSSGLHIGWATYNITELENWTDKHLSTLIVAIVHCGWLIGMLIGIAIGMFFVDITGRRQTQIGALVFFLTNGIISTGFHSYPGIIMLSEIIGGIGAGIIHITYIIMVGEITCRFIRGHIAAWGAVATLMGTLIFAFITYIVGNKAPLVFIGIITIVDTLIAACFFIAASPESPAFSMYKDMEDQSRTTLYALRLRDHKRDYIFKEPCKPNDMEMSADMLDGHAEDEFITRTEGLMQDLKLYVLIERVERWYFKRNIKKLAIILVTKILSVVSYNLSLNILLMGLFYKTGDIIWMYPVLISIRVFASITALLVVDIIGRKIIIAVSGLGTSLTLIALTVIIKFLAVTENSNWPPAYIFGLFQLFAGLGSIIPFVIPSELMPYRIKARTNGFACLLEVVLFIFTLLTWSHYTYTLTNEAIFVTLFVYSGVTLVGTVILLAIFKETKSLSLQECVEKN